ncbi:hypothetical protein LCGC14_3077740 [marine sediment metagenome]|uniref:Uncharacterized protein n=1 Tax=marine sediment metagenome TaxID=412755 RepID=A0A0F8WE30_9ZZZZ
MFYYVLHDKMVKRYYYYVSYVGIGSIFGSSVFDTDIEINHLNVGEILLHVTKALEKKNNIKQIVILNFQKLR